MQLTIPTTEDIRAAVRDELTAFFASNPFLHKAEPDDEIGGLELAERVTGYKPATIYDLCFKRQIPHSKRGKRLIFSKNELIEWLRSGKRKTVAEIAAEAEAR